MKYLRRLIWYVATRLLVLLCVLGLMTTAFYFSMNATNIYIIIKDGMAKRAQTIMMGTDESLEAYFSKSYLDRDAQYQSALAGQGEQAVSKGRLIIATVQGDIQENQSLRPGRHGPDRPVPDPQMAERPVQRAAQPGERAVAHPEHDAE